MTVSIVIPNWNRRELLLRLLETVKQQHRPNGLNLEIIVVDNGSRDGSVEAARALGVNVVALGENVGVSRALNCGIATSHGEFIALVNNDIELSKDWLANLLSQLSSGDVWFATGKILEYNNPDHVDGAGDAVCRGGTTWRLGHGKLDGAWCNTSRATYFPSATATVFRRSFFQRVGLLEERFFAYVEDTDLGLRAALKELRGAYVPQAKAYHHGSATAGSWSSQAVEWITCHQVLLLAKFYSLPMCIRFARAIAVAHILWGGMAIFRGRGMAWLRGLYRGILLFNSVRKSSIGLRTCSKNLSEVLVSAEAEITQIQQATSWDTYWKWYFRLAGQVSGRLS